MSDNDNWLGMPPPFFYGYDPGREVKTSHNIVSYGGGTNSTAMLIEMCRRNEPVDAIVFADTGGERPATYEYLALFNTWLQLHGYPPITIVKNDGMHKTLEAECLTKKRLPSVAFGFKSCSDKYKRRPFTKWLKALGLTNVVVCVGFDADEAHRAERGNASDDPYKKRFPLLEWDIGRNECVQIIQSAGLPQPGKSACFFCPNAKQAEILALPADLQQRAMAMEKNADLTSLKGLGRWFSWGALIRNDQAQLKLFEQCGEQGGKDGEDMPCDCFDGN